MCAERGVKEAYTNNTTHKCLIVDHSFDARKLKSQNWKHVEVAVCLYFWVNDAFSASTRPASPLPKYGCWKCTEWFVWLFYV